MWDNYNIPLSTIDYHHSYGYSTYLPQPRKKDKTDKDLSSKFIREKFRDKNIKSFHLKEMKNINNAKKKRRK